MVAYKKKLETQPAQSQTSAREDVFGVAAAKIRDVLALC